MSAIPHMVVKGGGRGPGLSRIENNTLNRKDVSSALPNFRPQSSINAQHEVVLQRKRVIQMEDESNQRRGGIVMQTRVGGINDLPKQIRNRRERVASAGSTRLVPSQILDPVNAEAVSGERKWDPQNPSIADLSTIRSKSRSELMRIHQRYKTLQAGEGSAEKSAELQNLREQMKAYSRGSMESIFGAFDKMNAQKEKTSPFPSNPHAAATETPMPTTAPPVPPPMPSPPVPPPMPSPPNEFKGGDKYSAPEKMSDVEFIKRKRQETMSDTLLNPSKSRKTGDHIFEFAPVDLKRKVEDVSSLLQARPNQRRKLNPEGDSPTRYSFRPKYPNRDPPPGPYEKEDRTPVGPFDGVYKGKDQPAPPPQLPKGKEKLPKGKEKEEIQGFRGDNLDGGPLTSSDERDYDDQMHGIDEDSLDIYLREHKGSESLTKSIKKTRDSVRAAKFGSNMEGVPPEGISIMGKSIGKIREFTDKPSEIRNKAFRKELSDTLRQLKAFNEKNGKNWEHNRDAQRATKDTINTLSTILRNREPSGKKSQKNEDN